MFQTEENIKVYKYSSLISFYRVKGLIIKKLNLLNIAALISIA